MSDTITSTSSIAMRVKNARHRKDKLTQNNSINQSPPKKETKKKSTKGIKIYPEFKTLEECTRDVPWFNFSGMKIKAKCVHVYDGDTIHVVFPVSGKFYKHHIRLLGLDTPEIRPKSEYDPREKEAAKIAREFLKDQILDKIIDIECETNDKYGRALAWIYLGNVQMNQLMLDKGYAIAYDGRTKSKFNFDTFPGLTQS